ncbi:MAG: hypothetical protein R3C11_02150 [Planctomycetaceae bacterium]
MGGGPSHVDTFDYKPDLIKHHAQDIDFTRVSLRHIRPEKQTETDETPLEVSTVWGMWPAGF